MLCRQTSASQRYRHSAAMLLALALLPGCAAIGSAMSPYSEKFSCKNRDHGQCIHPERAYSDAVAGISSKSDPSVTNDHRGAVRPTSSGSTRTRGSAIAPYLDYRGSIYRELQGLIEAPVTPMLRPGRTIRTLILAYADSARPDRLYMPRYVYSILEKPQWVVGDYLVSPLGSAERVPVIEQSREKLGQAQENDGGANDIPAPPQEQRQ